jgi:septal ring factor EnvC (AmiA/AmiB activator)
VTDATSWSCPFCGRQWNSPDRALNCHPSQYAANLQAELAAANETIAGLQQQNTALQRVLAGLQDLATDTLPAALADSAADRDAIHEALNALTARVAALEPHTPEEVPTDG